MNLSHLFLQKGFPLGTSLDEIQEWLNGKGNMENIQMRRDMERQFKVVKKKKYKFKVAYAII